MTKREYQRLLKKAATAYNLNSDEYTKIMDVAACTVEDWDKFCADLDEAIKTPPTEKQIAQHERKEKDKEIEAARRNLYAAQQRLNKALRHI